DARQHSMGAVAGAVVDDDQLLVDRDRGDAPQDTEDEALLVVDGDDDRELQARLLEGARTLVRGSAVVKTTFDSAGSFGYPFRPFSRDIRCAPTSTPPTPPPRSIAPAALRGRPAPRRATCTSTSARTAIRSSPASRS